MIFVYERKRLVVRLMALDRQINDHYIRTSKQYLTSFFTHVVLPEVTEFFTGI